MIKLKQDNGGDAWVDGSHVIAVLTTSLGCTVVLSSGTEIKTKQSAEEITHAITVEQRDTAAPVTSYGGVGS